MSRGLTVPYGRRAQGWERGGGAHRAFPHAGGHRRLEPKYVVASRRATFDWSNSYLLTGDLCESVQRLKAATPQGVLLGSAMLAGALDGLGLIDEYRFLIHPRIAGHGPRLHEGALRATRALELIAANPLGNGCVAVHYRRAPG